MWFKNEKKIGLTSRKILLWQCFSFSSSRKTLIHEEKKRLKEIRLSQQSYQFLYKNWFTEVTSYWALISNGIWIHFSRLFWDMKKKMKPNPFYIKTTRKNGLWYSKAKKIHFIKWHKNCHKNQIWYLCKSKLISKSGIVILNFHSPKEMKLLLENQKPMSIIFIW